MFLIFLAETPNLKVDIVYDKLYIWGEQVIISVVLEFPPNDYCKTLVNLESRYGTCVDLPSVNAFITFPNVAKLVFIFLA